jgi:hypothetical protein
MNAMYFSGPTPSPFERRARSVRGLFGTLTVVFLVAAGFVYGAIWYQVRGLEEEATQDGRKLAVQAVKPMLLPSDAVAPISGERYQQFLSVVEKSVTAGPINHVRLWREDGTILFADDASIVGTRDPAMRDELQAVKPATSETAVKGERFRILTSVRIGESSKFVVVELDRPHDALVQRVNKPWRPWMVRALIGAGISFGLYLAMAIGFLLYRVVKLGKRSLKRTNAKRKEAKAKEKADLPAYMQPGFQQEVEARRRAEEEVHTLERQRDDLVKRVHTLEGEPEPGGSGSAGQPTAPGARRS